MKTLDTNILLRYVLQDNAKLSPKAQQIIDTEPCHIPILALAEMGYVLRSFYGIDIQEIVQFAWMFLAKKGLTFEAPDRLAQALRGVELGVDWYDAMLWAVTPEPHQVMTFDKKFANKAKKLGWVPQVAFAA